MVVVVVEASTPVVNAPVPMDFVLALHGHLPYVLHHGRWPHGSVWLSEGALDSYLPLIEALQSLERDHIPAPITLGITPILANQLSHPSFVSEFEAYMARRLETAAQAPASLAASGDSSLVPLARFWQEHLERLHALFRSLNGDLIGAFRGFEARGVIEVMSSAATHGFLPLLARDESIRLQLAVGVMEHRRLFGRAPTGCWLPECAYRPAGPWSPGYGGTPSAYRAGIDEHLAAAGYRYFFVDAHLVRAGPALGYPYPQEIGEAKGRSPYTAYRVASKAGKAHDLFALVRDPRSSGQVWSRAEGYPGDEWYLEFHKIRWPDGLRLWRVTGAQTNLGDKRRYEPEAAQNSARTHAAHFARVLHDTATQRKKGVVAAPFDAELFGHWWFEGVDFLTNVYRALASDGVRPVTARQHIAAAAKQGAKAAPAIQLTEGSWGKDGNFSMWLNDQTAWTWRRLWALEESYWAVARQALAGDDKRKAVLAQATRSMLLAQASDWQFIISTGEAGDYATLRFDEHCAQAEDLIRALGSKPEIDEATMQRVEALAVQDSVFPNVLQAIEAVLK